jgi:hypothetical protein
MIYWLSEEREKSLKIFLWRYFFSASCFNGCWWPIYDVLLRSVLSADKLMIKNISLDTYLQLLTWVEWVNVNESGTITTIPWIDVLLHNYNDPILRCHYELTCTNLFLVGSTFQCTFSFSIRVSGVQLNVLWRTTWILCSVHFSCTIFTIISLHNQSHFPFWSCRSLAENEEIHANCKLISVRKWM